MENTSLKVAVLFLVFNRLNTVKQVFQAIREAKPPRLYIASDGPRSTHFGEDEQVQSVRDYVLANMDWECSVETLFREQNLGCKCAVESAITWFFEHEEMGIILEDDCFPDLSFFQFCQCLLEYYRDDKRIMSIAGNNFQFGRKHTGHSYYFSGYAYCWGWATWSRAWNLYDKDMRFWPTILAEGWMYNIFDSPFEKSYLTRKYQMIYEGKISSWAYLWDLTCRIQSGLAILPRVNLVSNIGFSRDGTHTKSSHHPCSNIAVSKIDFPLEHPPFVKRNVNADLFTLQKINGFLPRIMRKIRSVFQYFN